VTKRITKKPVELMQNMEATMADAYKFLQDLDTYYGDRARVRFGKRGALMEILRNREMDNFNLGKSASNGGELVTREEFTYNGKI